MPSPKHEPVVLADEPRPARPRLITDDNVDEVITRTLEATPGQDTHWSTRLMASAMGMSQSAMSRIWPAFGLKPHAIETGKQSVDLQFVDKVRDVLVHRVVGPQVAAHGSACAWVCTSASQVGRGRLSWRVAAWLVRVAL